MAMNPALQGRTYQQAEVQHIRAERCASYQEAVSAQLNDAHSEEPSHQIPPALPLVMCQGALSAVLLDGDLGLDTMRLVYRALDVTFHRLPPLDAEIQASARVEQIRQEKEGSQLLLKVQLEESNGPPVLTATAEFWERNPRPKSIAEDEREGLPPSLADKGALQIFMEQKVELRLDAVAQMLDELGEFNPVYRDVELAQLANLPAPCVPPSYLYAIAHHVLSRALGNDAVHLKSLSGCFARPAWIGDTLQVEVGSEDGESGWLQIRDGAGRSVFADGRFEVAPRAARAGR